MRFQYQYGKKYNIGKDVTTAKNQKESLKVILKKNDEIRKMEMRDRLIVVMQQVQGKHLVFIQEDGTEQIPTPEVLQLLDDIVNQAIIPTLADVLVAAGVCFCEDDNI